AIAFAAEKTTVTLKQSIEIAKSSLGLNTEGYEFTSNYNENQNGHNVWNLNWNNSKTNTESINVSIDADTGKIMTVSWWVPNEQSKSRIPKHTKAEALKAAQELAAKLQGENFKQTRLMEAANNDYYNKYAETYNFEFIRVHDGVDVPVNNISIQLDKNTLKLRYFNVVWDEGELPSKTKAFSLEKAKELLKSKLGLELTYNLVYNNQNNEPSVVLAYTMKNGNSPIDAITGELLNNYIIRSYYSDEKSANAASTGNVVITPEEQSELEKNNEYISKSEAEQAIKQYITIDNKMKLERANLYHGYNKENATWNLEWRYSNSEDNSYRYINVQIDAVNKEIKSFNISDNSYGQDKDKATINKEQAKKLAEDFLKVIQPNKFDKTQYKEYKEPFGYAPVNNNYYSFNFIRVENGVPCPSNSLNVGVNTITGEIVSFNTSWSNINFPAPNKVITLDKAYEVLFNKVEFEMQYIHHFINTNDSESKELKLAYVLENMPVLIDANSSLMIGYDGKPITPIQKLQYTDIKGNKAEDEIMLLIEMGIIEPDSTEFMPDSTM
ncbi:MAG: YcdB/YcdC domain-containing protein, partial [Lutisporaceae bacterium]